MPASITLTITSFQDTDSTAAGSRYCTADMALAPDPAGKVTQAGNRLRVKGPTDLEFTIAAPAGSPESYFALGIVFKSGSADKHGRNNFDIKNHKVNDAKISIRNNHSVSAPASSGGVVYEFFILIQRVSDGAIGIIDPEIENQDLN